MKKLTIIIYVLVSFLHYDDLPLISQSKDLQRERQLTYLFISRNMEVIRYMCKRIAVMYKGELVEVGETQDVFENPQHPYTEKLLSSVLSVQTEETVVGDTIAKRQF